MSPYTKDEKEFLGQIRAIRKDAIRQSDMMYADSFMERVSNYPTEPPSESVFGLPMVIGVSLIAIGLCIILFVAGVIAPREKMSDAQMLIQEAPAPVYNVYNTYNTTVVQPVTTQRVIESNGDNYVCIELKSDPDKRTCYKR